MLDLRYFRNPAFSTGTTGMVLVFMAMFGVMFLITQYFQLVLDYSPLEAALRLLPMAPVMIIVAPLTPRLSARYGANRVVSVGLGTVTVGLLLFRLLDVDTGYPQVLGSMLLLVTGIALTMSPMTAAIMSAVPPRRAGAGSAMNDATRELGASLGIAVLGTVFFGHVEGAGPPTIDRFTSAVQTCIWVAVAMVAVAWLLTFLLPRRAEHHGAH
jgi:predicted MFS family arabinose efflux permease